MGRWRLLRGMRVSPGLAAAATVLLPLLAGPATPATGAAASPPSGYQPPVAGVTVDDTSNLGPLLSSLTHLPRTPTVRIVFDVDPAHPASTAAWKVPVRRISAVAPVMGELVDSSQIAQLTVRQVKARATRFVAAFRNQVTTWEVGNEVNGNWTGAPVTVARKVTAAYDAVMAAGGSTALTLYENHGCGDGPTELAPADWAKKYLTPSLRDGIDQVLLSYYEDQCGGIRPSAKFWQGEFGKLHKLFPAAQLGFGEIGMARPATGSTQAEAESLITHYYGLDVDVPGWIGGCFWWYFAEDMVPWRNNQLFKTLSTAIG